MVTLTDEDRVVARIKSRLEQGRRCYGNLNIATDPRDWLSEGHNELLDYLVYRAIDDTAMRDVLCIQPGESVLRAVKRLVSEHATLKSKVDRVAAKLVGNSDTTMSTVDAAQRLVDDMVEIRTSLEQATKEVGSLRAIKSEWMLMCGALGHPRHPAVAIKDLQDEHARMQGYLAEIRKELDTFRGVACHRPHLVECNACNYWQYSHDPYGPAGLGHCLAKECPHA
jgi:hypothetical protein